MRRDLVELVQAHPYILLGAFLLLRWALWAFVEHRTARYRINLREVFLTDLTTTLFLFLVTIPICDRIAMRVLPYLPLPASLHALPLWLRIVLYLVLADFGHYWVHRLMHTRWLWRVHKWHHLPTHMTWLAGNRASFPDRLLVSLPYFFFWPIVQASPWWMGTLLLMFAGIKNDWMHLNTTLRMAWLERIVITPRYHHVHHSAAPEHNTKNLAPLFSVWDHLFGTYAKPEDSELSFGIGERVKTARLIIGL